MLRVSGVSDGAATRSYVCSMLLAPNAAPLVIAATPQAPSAVQEKPLSMQCPARGAASQPPCSSGAARTDMLRATWAALSLPCA